MKNTHRYPISQGWLETRGFRPEIQGLRALALFLVVSYHIWFGRVSGGVDVFLFISAFLLSLSSMRKVNEGKAVEPFKYWLHVFQRLLPAAVTVVAGTVIATYLFLPASRLASIINDAIATLLYFLNWRLAFNSVDYYAQDAATKTPLQHYWSLSMQGQIFILWPLLFILVAILVRKFRLPLLSTALTVFGIIFVCSLSFSIFSTYGANQQFAYFDTRARLWEFAGGTLLALLAFRWKAPEYFKVPMGWVGIIGLISCGFVLPVEQSFPGFLALWPLVSAALIIVAGQTNSVFGVDKFLSSAPMLKLGEISYALYLVHWPVFVFYSSISHKEHPSFLVGTGLILLSMVVAWLIHTFIEQPLRKIGNRKDESTVPWKKSSNSTSPIFRQYLVPATVIFSCLALVGLPLVAGRYYVQQRDLRLAQAAEAGAGSPQFPGALAINEPMSNFEFPPIPQSDPLAQYDGLETGTCVGDFELSHPELNGSCGLAQNSDEEAPLIILVGGSHVGQSVSMYRKLAEEAHFNLMDLHTGGCRFPLEAEPVPSEDCLEYNEFIMDEILTQQPAAVGLMITQTDPGTNEEILVPGIEPEIKKLTEAGIQVIGLRDNPRWSTNMFDCALTSLDDLQICASPVAEKMAETNPAQELIDSSNDIFGVDLTELYCPDGTCQAVLGNVVVYMDDNHISKAYAGTTYEEFARQLEAQGWTPESRSEAR